VASKKAPEFFVMNTFDAMVSAVGPSFSEVEAFAVPVQR